MMGRNPSLVVASRTAATHTATVDISALAEGVGFDAGIHFCGTRCRDVGLLPEPEMKSVHVGSYFGLGPLREILGSSSLRTEGFVSYAAVVSHSSVSPVDSLS